MGHMREIICSSVRASQMVVVTNSPLLGERRELVTFSSPTHQHRLTSVSIIVPTVETQPAYTKPHPPTLTLQVLIY